LPYRKKIAAAPYFLRKKISNLPPNLSFQVWYKIYRINIITTPAFPMLIWNQCATHKEIDINVIKRRYQTSVYTIKVFHQKLGQGFLCQRTLME
jgi:hypothetical protein